jgi:hypothetical protein
MISKSAATQEDRRAWTFSLSSSSRTSLRSRTAHHGHHATFYYALFRSSSRTMIEIVCYAVRNRPIAVLGSAKADLAGVARDFSRQAGLWVKTAYRSSPTSGSGSRKGTRRLGSRWDSGIGYTSKRCRSGTRRTLTRWRWGGREASLFPGYGHHLAASRMDDLHERFPSLHRWEDKDDGGV